MDDRNDGVVEAMEDWDDKCGRNLSSTPPLQFSITPIFFYSFLAAR